MKTNREMVAMMERSLTEVEDGVLCNLCGHVICDRPGFKRHFRDQHYDRAVKYRCPVCRKVYKNKSTVAVHMSNKHRHVKGIDLEKCRVAASCDDDNEKNEDEV